MSTEGLLKTAADALRSVRSENEQLKSEMQKFAAAKELVFRLWKLGSFPAEELEDQLDEFLGKTHDELVTFEKAASLVSGKSFTMNLGNVSDLPGVDESPEGRFISSLLD